MRLPNHITLTRADSGAVLLNGRTGRYYQLNLNGSLVLTALLGGATAADAAAQLAAAYPEAADRASADTAALITQLTSAGLVEA